MADKNFSPFSNILSQGIMNGMMPARNKQAREWFRQRARKSQTTADALMNVAKANRSRGRVVIGRMYLYRYDPKTKDDLPYYDTAPLIFPIKHNDDGFLGINLHYLPYVLRAKLMDALYAATTNKKFDYTTKLRLSYQILNRAAKFRYFKPCLKRYLTSHVKSDFIEIYSAEWDIALFMPLQRFVKKSASEVWRDSEKMIRN